MTLLVLTAAPASAAGPVAARVSATDAFMAGACGALPGTAGGAVRSWYRRVSRADDRGWLRGYTFSAGLVGGPTTIRQALPNESFVTGPYGGVLVYGRDGGDLSEVRAVRLADGCDTRILVSDDVVRGAILDMRRGQLYLHIVDRRTRADRGIWRRTLGVDSGPRRIMAGLAEPASGPFGRTGVTLLDLSPSGRMLAVQSCGEVLCRTRLYDTRTGAVTLDERRGQGELIGLTDTERFGYLGCHGLPCPIVTISAGGRLRTIVDSAVTATLVGEGDHRQLWYEAPDGIGGIELRRLVLASGADQAIPDRTGLRLAWPSRWADAGIDAPPGSVLLTTDGSWSSAGDVVSATFDGSDLRLRSLPEVSE